MAMVSYYNTQLGYHQKKPFIMDADEYSWLYNDWNSLLCEEGLFEEPVGGGE